VLGGIPNSLAFKDFVFNPFSSSRITAAFSSYVSVFSMRFHDDITKVMRRRVVNQLDKQLIGNDNLNDYLMSNDLYR